MKRAPPGVRLVYTSCLAGDDPRHAEDRALARSWCASGVGRTPWGWMARNHRVVATAHGNGQPGDMVSFWYSPRAAPDTAAFAKVLLRSPVKVGDYVYENEVDVVSRDDE